MAIVIKNLLFTVFIPGTVAIFVPLWITQNHEPASSWSSFLSYPVYFVGSAVYFWCVWDFATFGKATPIPLDAPQKLVVRGLYRYTRNPMYLGVLSVLLGWVLLFQTVGLVVYGMLVGTGFHLFIVLYEERCLHGKFGGEYIEYCSRVGRWFPRRRQGQAT